MAQLLQRFNNTNKNSPLDVRVSSIESFLQLFTDELVYLLGNLTLKNFSSTAVSSLKGEIKTGTNNLVELSNNLKIQWGDVLVTPTSAGASVSKTIVFNKAFSNPPSILLTPYTSTSQSVFCSYKERKTKEFKLVLCRNDTTPTTVSWIAIGI